MYYNEIYMCFIGFITACSLLKMLWIALIVCLHFHIKDLDALPSMGSICGNLLIIFRWFTRPRKEIRIIYHLCVVLYGCCLTYDECWNVWIRWYISQDLSQQMITAIKQQRDDQQYQCDAYRVVLIVYLQGHIKEYV